MHRAWRSGGPAITWPSGHCIRAVGLLAETRESSPILGSVFIIQRMQNRIKQIGLPQEREEALPETFKREFVGRMGSICLGIHFNPSVQPPPLNVYDRNSNLFWINICLLIN